MINVDKSRKPILIMFIWALCVCDSQVYELKLHTVGHLPRMLRLYLEVAQNYMLATVSQILFILIIMCLWETLRSELVQMFVHKQKQSADVMFLYTWRDYRLLLKTQTHTWYIKIYKKLFKSVTKTLSSGPLLCTKWNKNTF